MWTGRGPRGSGSNPNSGPCAHTSWLLPPLSLTSLPWMEPSAPSLTRFGQVAPRYAILVLRRALVFQMSNALSVCTAVGLFCLMGPYAVGSTQHLKTSIYIFALVVVVLFVAVVLLLICLLRGADKNGNIKLDEEQGKKVKEKKWDGDREERKKHARRKYLMLLGILVASVAYQAGLKPPGGAWKSTGNGYEAGNPVMHDNRRHRYLAFFYSNSISFMASIAVIIILLRQWLPSKEKGDWEKQSLRVMNWMIRLDLVALLMAYAAGSNRGWKTSIYVATLIVVVLGYFAIHMILSCICHRMNTKGDLQREDPRHGSGVVILCEMWEQLLI